MRSLCTYFFSMSASALSSLKQNLKKPDILGKLMLKKLHDEMNFFFELYFIYRFFVICFSINCIRAPTRITIMEMAVQLVVAFAAILMNHSAIMILIMCSSSSSSSDIKTKVFLQRKQWKCGKGEVKEGNILKKQHK